MRVLGLFTATLVIAVTATTHDLITTNLSYTRDISRVFSRHCVACHGAASPIPLTTYQQVRPWAVSIKERVLARNMPPWGAVKGFGELSPDYGLSQEEILIVAAWVIGGAPQGNAQLLPVSNADSTTPPPPQLKDVLVVQNHAQLSQSLRISGIRPIAGTKVKSARLTARLPEGRIEPLLWLYQYDSTISPQTFTFRRSLELPQGTVIESTAPLRFALQALKAP